MTTPAAEIKTCCANLYASDWVRLLVGESFHPGGLALTERLGQLLGLSTTSRVLDVAAGRGASALHLARVFGCKVTGIDYSGRSVSLATERAEREDLHDRVDFRPGDAEQLSALADASFDAVFCECAYCTFPNKHAAAAEIARVLVPGGRFGLSDLTRNGPMPPELDGLLAWMACVGDAQPVASYVAGLQAVGFTIDRIEGHDQALIELVEQVRGRLLAADLVTKIQKVELPGDVDLQLAKRMARSATEAARAGILGYSLIIATKPAH